LHITSRSSGTRNSWLGSASLHILANNYSPLNEALAGKGISMSKCNQSSKIKNPVLFGIAMGVAMGASLGTALSSVTFGVSIGIAMSVAFWASAKNSNK